MAASLPTVISVLSAISEATVLNPKTGAALAKKAGATTKEVQRVLAALDAVEYASAKRNSVSNRIEGLRVVLHAKDACAVRAGSHRNTVTLWREGQVVPTSEEPQAQFKQIEDVMAYAKDRGLPFFDGRNLRYILAMAPFILDKVLAFEASEATAKPKAAAKPNVSKAPSAPKV